MHIGSHPRDRDRSAWNGQRPPRQAARTIAVLALAVLVTALCITGPATAADDQGTFTLAKVTHGWPSGSGIAADEPYVINEIQYDSKGGYIDFTALPPSKSAACSGVSQHFRCTWTFSKDVSTLSGRTGDPVFEVYVKWEADAPVPDCVNDYPYIMPRWSAIWGPSPAESARGFLTITTDPPWGELRYYPPLPDTKNPPTAVYRMNLPELAGDTTGGFSISTHFANSRPSWGGNNLVVAYVYDRVDDGTPTGTTEKATTAATQATTAPSSTGGGTGACSWTGTWQTNFGEMYLSQTGDQVTGTYVWDNGRIEGTVSGDTFTGRWSEAPSYQGPSDAGQFILSMASDCGSFTGTAGYGSSSTGIAQSGTRTAGGTAATTAAARTTAPLTTTAGPTTIEQTTPPTTVATTAATTESTGGGGAAASPLPAGLAIVALAGAGLAVLARRSE